MSRRGHHGMALRAALCGLILGSVAGFSQSADATGASSVEPDVTVTPSVVVPVAQHYQVSGQLEGTGAVVTVSVGPNKVLVPGYPVEVQECIARPSTSADCDMTTTLPFDELTKARVLAKPNGSVTIHFLAWSPLPDKWDPNSNISVGLNKPMSLWVGDDPSRWATTGFVSAPITLLAPGSKAPPARSSSTLNAAADPSGGSGSSSNVTLMVVVGVLALLAGAAFAAFFTRRRSVRA